MDFNGMHGPSKTHPVSTWTVFLATTTMRLRLRGTSWVMALSGALTGGLMSATNFALHSDFRWVLLLPVLVWLAGLAAYVSKP